MVRAGVIGDGVMRMGRCVPCRTVTWETDKNAPRDVNSAELGPVVVLGIVLTLVTVEERRNLDRSACQYRTGGSVTLLIPTKMGLFHTLLKHICGHL